MEKIEKGLALEELEAQSAELLPDRLEMRRWRRRRGNRIRRNASEGFTCSPVNVQVGDENEIEQEVVCFRIDT
jgi:hypothetical protein